MLKPQIKPSADYDVKFRNGRVVVTASLYALGAMLLAGLGWVAYDYINVRRAAFGSRDDFTVISKQVDDLHNELRDNMKEIRGYMFRAIRGLSLDTSPQNHNGATQ